VKRREFLGGLGAGPYSMVVLAGEGSRGQAQPEFERIAPAGGVRRALPGEPHMRQIGRAHV